MTIPYLKRIREPRFLLHSLTITQLGQDLWVDQHWWNKNMLVGLRRQQLLRGAHAKLPLTCTVEWDWTGGWSEMARVLHYLGLPTRRIIVTGYAFKRASLDKR